MPGSTVSVQLEQDDKSSNITHRSQIDCHINPIQPRYNIEPLKKQFAEITLMNDATPSMKDAVGRMMLTTAMNGKEIDSNCSQLNGRLYNRRNTLFRKAAKLSIHLPIPDMHQYYFVRIAEIDAERERELDLYNSPVTESYSIRHFFQYNQTSPSNWR